MVRQKSVRKKKLHPPSLCHHKSDDSAVVYLNRRMVYLGTYGSQQAKDRYQQVIGEWMKGQQSPPPRRSSATSRPPSLSVADLCAAYCDERLKTFSADEQACQKGAIRVLVTMFPDTPVVPTPERPDAHFGPLRLTAVRNAMIAGDPEAKDLSGNHRPRKPWSRDYINHQICRIRSIFRWGISKQIVPQVVADALGSLSALKANECPDAGNRPRDAVAADKIEAVRAELNERNRDIFDLLLLTGARPNEIISLTSGLINRAGDVWRVDLEKHKNSHRGKSRTLWFNSSAQLILRKYLSADPSKRLFSVQRRTFGTAIRVAAERAFQMPAELRNPPKTLTPAELADVKRRAKAWRQEYAFVPNELRNTVAVQLTDALGLESAQRLLGHSKAAMTAHYAKGANRTAIEAVQRLG